MPELIERAVEIAINGGDMDAVWYSLKDQYPAFGDPVEVHMAVLDGADVIIREMYPS